MAKAGRKIQGDHKLSGLEIKRRHDDKAVSIDQQLDEAMSKIDKKRRQKAEKDIVKWVKTYCCDGLMLEDEPPQKGEEVLREMFNATTSHSNYCILMPRGHGKSSYILCMTLFAIATGLQKYVVIISHDARAAGSLMQDLWRAVQETDTKFAQDYPELTLPFQVCQGSFRRRQLYHGKSTEIQKNAGQLVFARLQDESGVEMPTSGSIVTCRGVSGGLRGMKKGTLRPTLVLLDDLQTSEIAENPQAVDKLMNTIRKDIIPLAGKTRLSILQTATQICQDDLVDKIKADKSWKTTTYKAVIHFPKNRELWGKYFEIYDTESVQGFSHSESLEFYKKNREEMDEGSEVFNPTRFAKVDGHISCIQKMMELKHAIGDAAFMAEYQMSPLKTTFSIDISPEDVCRKIGSFKHLEVPDQYIYVIASTDLNLSKYLTTTIVAFKKDMSAAVVHHEFDKCNIDLRLPDTQRNQLIYDLLSKHGKHLSELGLKINAWGLDASGTPFNAVCEFSKNSMQICGIPACAMCGRANHIFNGFVRSRLRDESNKTVLCGDPREHVKAGSGFKYMFWSSDYYRVIAQKAFLAEVGAPGGCLLFNANARIHSEFAIQMCNEKLMYMSHKPDGRDFYSWRSKDPHDVLDSVAQAFAIAGSQGISGNNIETNVQRKKAAFTRKARIRVV